MLLVRLDFFLLVGSAYRMLSRKAKTTVIHLWVEEKYLSGGVF